MKALFITILVILLLAYILYRIYMGYLILNKQRKYNKSTQIGEWYINSHPFRRLFMFGTFKNVKVEKYHYKILKDEEDLDENKIEKRNNFID